MKRTRFPIKRTKHTFGTYIASIAKAKAYITKLVGGQRNLSGRVPCPLCSTPKKPDRLFFSIKRNGVTIGRCTNDNCVYWYDC